VCLPALRAVQAHPAEVVAFTHPFSVQEMAAAAGGRAFFLVETPEAFQRLAGALLDRGTGEFLLLADDPISASGPISGTRYRGHIRISPLGRYGLYVVHEVAVLRGPD
jgi:hypothetical protein